MRKLVWTVMCLWRMEKQFVEQLDKLEFVDLYRKGN